MVCYVIVGCGESVDLRGGGGGKNVIMCLVFAIKNGARSTIRLEIYICVLSFLASDNNDDIKILVILSFFDNLQCR